MEEAGGERRISKSQSVQIMVDMDCNSWCIEWHLSDYKEISQKQKKRKGSMEDARGERKKEFSKPTPKVCSVVATSLWMIVNWLKELLANAACAQLLNLLSFLFLAFVVFTTSLSSNHCPKHTTKVTSQSREIGKRVSCTKVERIHWESIKTLLLSILPANTETDFQQIANNESPKKRVLQQSANFFFFFPTLLRLPIPSERE